MLTGQRFQEMNPFLFLLIHQIKDYGARTSENRIARSCLKILCPRVVQPAINMCRSFAERAGLTFPFSSSKARESGQFLSLLHQNILVTEKLQINIAPFLVSILITFLLATILIKKSFHNPLYGRVCAFTVCFETRPAGISLASFIKMDIFSTESSCMRSTRLARRMKPKRKKSLSA